MLNKLLSKAAYKFFEISANEMTVWEMAGGWTLRAIVDNPPPAHVISTPPLH